MTELSPGAADIRTQALSLPPASAHAAGELVNGRYRLGGRLGRGSSADVFHATDEVLERSVAVKVFRFDAATGDDRRRVDAEMRMLASLHHPGLVAIFDAGTLADREAVAGELQGTPYLVMELVNGPSLSQRLDDGALSGPDTAALGVEIAAALAYIHARNIVHRDVKPANILLESAAGVGDGSTVKLADFGIARAVDGTRFTSDGLTIGTPNYLSPEQALGHDVGPATDVYALGLVLIQCLTGEPAFSGSGLEAALVRLHRQPEVPAHLGRGWVELLTTMTSREADQRPSAADAARSLERLTRGPLGAMLEPQPLRDRAGFDTGITELMPAGGPRIRRRVVAFGVGALAVALVLALGIYLVRGAHGTASEAPTSPAPYPSVSGQLGSDLLHLQRIVQ